MRQQRSMETPASTRRPFTGKNLFGGTLPVEELPRLTDDQQLRFELSDTSFCRPQLV